MIIKFFTFEINIKKKRNVTNVFFNQQYDKWVLISYIFYKNPIENPNHTNYYESNAIISYFQRNGYNIDFIIHDSLAKSICYEKYNIIFGFGNPIDNYIENNYSSKIKLILYCTGFNPEISNYLTYENLKNYYMLNNTIITKKNLRIYNKDLNLSLQFADAIIVYGDGKTLESYDKYKEKVAKVTPFFLPNLKHKELRNISLAKNFIWFGSSGAFHKGLFYLLNYFKINSKLNLYIFGLNKFEKELQKDYNFKNIFFNSFLDTSKINLLQNYISFTILPSISEGGSPSILTSILYFNALPIITENCGLPALNNDAIIIKELNQKEVNYAIEEAIKIPDQELKRRIEKIKKIVLETYNYKNYIIDLENNLNLILKEKY